MTEPMGDAEVRLAHTFRALQWPLPNEAADRWADRVCVGALKDAGILAAPAGRAALAAHATTAAAARQDD